jgi:DNA-binding response OmpR family regulator
MVKQSVLLIEDDPDTIKLLSVLFKLEKIHFKSPPALEEDVIIQQVFSNKYTRLIVDVNVSNINGIDIVKRIRQEAIDYHPYIIMLSGLDMTERCLSAGADAFFQKPFDPAKLISLLKTNK